MRLNTYMGRQGLLRRCAVAGIALLTILLTAGCRKQARASHQNALPPPPYAQSPRKPSVSARQQGAPQESVNDNLAANGLVAATETGLASWYGPPYANRRGANGQIYDSNALTAAHRTLPMGTVVRVTNLATNQAVTVKITDRGPFVHGRLLDLSIAAAKSTGVYRMGVSRVRVEVVRQGLGATVPGRWCVQVGAFLNAGNADRLKADLLHRYSSSAKVIEFPGPTGHWVRINPLPADRARATAIAGNIHPTEAGAQAYLVRLD